MFQGIVFSINDEHSAAVCNVCSHTFAIHLRSTCNSLAFCRWCIVCVCMCDFAFVLWIVFVCLLLFGEHTHTKILHIHKG